MFQKIQKTIGVSDFRTSVAKYLKQAGQEPLVISTQRGNQSFVILSADDYNALVEKRENEIDSKEIIKLVKESKKGKKIPWEKIR